MQLENVEDVYPLSPMQQGLLFHSLYAPNSEVYFQQFSCRLRGDFDTEAFRRAWQKVLDRHSILRTAFFWDGLDEPLQVVRQQAEMTWETPDWRDVPADEVGERLREYLKADVLRGFDFNDAPLMRVALISLPGGSYQFVWSYHHLVLDGWSKQLILGEVFTFYSMIRHGRDGYEPPSPRPFRDYIEWLGRQDMARAESFWRGRLKGLKGATRLGVVGGAGGATRQDYPEHNINLTDDAAENLRRMAREQKVTLNTVVEGAWALLLSRYSGERDVVFGATVSGRPAELAGIDGMIGLFINTLPVRVEVREDETVGAWLRELQRRQFEAREYEYSPLVEVQGWSDVRRGDALFESLYVFENYPVEKSMGDWGKRAGMDGARGIERTSYPLTVVVMPGEGLSVKLMYDAAQLGEETIERLASHLQTVLEQMSANPSARVSDVEILTEAERRQLLVEWNEAAHADSGKCVHELVEEQARRAPDSVAVVYGDERVTYGELNRRANRLARHLRERGVGPESVVGVYLERGAAMIAALLGVLKAGGAYLPVEPDYPKDRAAFMLEDSRASVLITEERLAGALPYAPPTVVRLDSEAREIEQHSAGDPASVTDSRNLAYVIYTSGSTGKPKGALIAHEQVSRLFAATDEWFSFGPSDVWTMFHSYAFDFSVWEIWGALVHGGAVVVVADEVRKNPEAFYSLLAAERVTVLNQTPSAFKQLGEAEAERGVDPSLALRLVIFGGEALELRGLRGWFQRHGDARPTLVNMYGITETTVHVTYRPVRAEEAWAETASVIGVRIPDLKLYVLDDRQRPVPVGISGEACVGGAGLARGYLGRPDLTAERFIPNGYATREGERLYRSGDLALFRPAGELEYVGRADNQVKVRGHRIELGEIEAALCEHESVADCVVLTREAEGGDRRLVAYTVARGAESAGTSELRAFLKQSLPDYMIPAAFVAIDAIPLTGNGKVDRKALPEPEQSRPELEGDFVAPRNAVEDVISGIWAEVLGLSTVGVNDNFFDLGGNSLLAVQVISRAREAFQTELSIRLLFEDPTVAGLARGVERAVAASGGLEAPPVVPTGRGGELPLSFAQEQLWFIDQLEPGTPAYNIQVASRLSTGFNTRALEDALTEIVRRHEILRTAFPSEGGRPSQSVAQPRRVSLPVVDLGRLDPSARESAMRELIAGEVRRPFDLGRGPAMRVRVLRLGRGERVLLFVFHHIVFDAWSSNLLMRELTALCEAFARGGQSPLEELPVQYADYARWQREWLSGDVLKSLISYWRQQLAGAPAVLELPTDRPRRDNSPSRAASEYFSLSAELTASLKELARREGVTLFMVILSALQTLLSRYSGQEDVSVGTPVAGRDRVETEGLIGCFINTLVLRARLAPETRFRELLQQARQVTLEAYAHQDVPFKKIVDAIRPDAAASHTPLYQVLLNLDNSATAGQQDDADSSGWIPAKASTAKLDLMFDMLELDGSLTGVVEYKAALFDAERIKRMVGHFQTLLASAAANPDARLGALEMLTEEEKEQRARKDLGRAALNRRKLASIAPQPVRIG